MYFFQLQLDILVSKYNYTYFILKIWKYICNYLLLLPSSVL